MSQTIQEQEQEKSKDKKEIAEEEREKMLNVENVKQSSKTLTTDPEKDENKPKRKIPIGGIKMPGFCRNKVKEDNDVRSSEKVDVECGVATSKEREQNIPSVEKLTNAGKESKEKDSNKGFIHAIRLPLASVFPRKKKEIDADHDTVGLASVEALDSATEKITSTDETIAESVRLDENVFSNDNLPKPYSFIIFLSAARRNLFVTGFFSEQAMEALHYDFSMTWDKYKVSRNNPDYIEKLLRAVCEYNSRHI